MQRLPIKSFIKSINSILNYKRIFDVLIAHKMAYCCLEDGVKVQAGQFIFELRTLVVFFFLWFMFNIYLKLFSKEKFVYLKKTLNFS